MSILVLCKWKVPTRLFLVTQQVFFFIENVFNGKQSEFLHILLIIGYLCFFIIITVLGYLHLFKFFNISLKQASRLKIYVSSVNEYCKNQENHYLTIGNKFLFKWLIFVLCKETGLVAIRDGFNDATLVVISEYCIITWLIITFIKNKCLNTCVFT